MPETRNGPVSRFLISNHLTLLVALRETIPVVSLRVAFKYGHAYDPDGQEGLAKMTAFLLKKGTLSRSAIQFSEELESLGSSMSVSVGADGIFIELQCLTKFLKESLALLTDAVWNPAFLEDEIARAKKQLLAQVRRKKDFPGQILSDGFAETVYGSHPYARSGDGAEKTIEGLNREMVSKFHQKMTRSEIIVSLAGKTNIETITAWLQSGWMKAKTGSGETFEKPKKTEPRIVIFNKETTQVNLAIGNLTNGRNHPDYYPSVVMNHILGGSGLASRLTDRIRTKNGLAYSVYSTFQRRWLAGIFSAQMQTKPENTAAAIQMIDEEFQRISDEPVTETELTDAKKYFRGHFPFRLETNDQYIYHLEQGEFYGLGLDYLDREIPAIEAVDSTMVIDSAGRNILKESRIIFAVGPANILEVQLAKFGQVEIFGKERVNVAS